MYPSLRGLERRTVLTVEQLEARLAPAVLDLPTLHGYLQYTTGPSGNTVTVDELLGKVYITDTDIIFLTQDAIDAGWIGNLQNIVSGPTDTFSSLEVWLGQGNDLIHAFSGWDSHSLVVHGGSGNDTISGGASYDRFFGDEGNDQLYGGEGADTLDGGAGNDRLEGNSGSDRLTGGDGKDTCLGGAGTDQLVETANEKMTLTDTTLKGGTTLGSNTHSSIERAWLHGGSGHNRLDATAFTGSSILHGYGGRDTLLGGKGIDYLSGHGGADVLMGGLGDDELNGGPGNDTCNGGKGVDLLLAEYGADMELTNTRFTGSGLGTDVLTSIERAHLSMDQGVDGATIDANAFTRGPVTLIGSDGDDTLIGTDKDDELIGMAGDDLLRGRAGDDTLNGGDGDDTLNGGDGTDEGIDGEVENNIEN